MISFRHQYPKFVSECCDILRIHDNVKVSTATWRWASPPQGPPCHAGLIQLAQMAPVCLTLVICSLTILIVYRLREHVIELCVIHLLWINCWLLWLPPGFRYCKHLSAWPPDGLPSPQRPPSSLHAHPLLYHYYYIMPMAWAVTLGSAGFLITLF